MSVRGDTALVTDNGNAVTSTRDQTATIMYLDVVYTDAITDGTPLYNIPIITANAHLSGIIVKTDLILDSDGLTGGWDV